MRGSNNIQNLERRNWRGIYPETLGHKLVVKPGKSTIDIVLDDLEKLVSKSGLQTDDSTNQMSQRNENSIKRYNGEKKGNLINLN